MRKPSLGRSARATQTPEGGSGALRVGARLAILAVLLWTGEALAQSPAAIEQARAAVVGHSDLQLQLPGAEEPPPLPSITIPAELLWALVALGVLFVLYHLRDIIPGLAAIGGRGMGGVRRWRGADGSIAGGHPADGRRARPRGPLCRGDACAPAEGSRRYPPAAERAIRRFPDQPRDHAAGATFRCRRRRASRHRARRRADLFRRASGGARRSMRPAGAGSTS